MKALVSYWLIVSVFMGIGGALRTRECPNEPWPSTADIALTYVAFPMMVIAVAFGGKEKSKCQ